uniref:Uncharacterized protein n=1 Tax=Oryza brachyantha TaxID=4533 RepID=J3LVY1_ORYBR
MPPPAFLPVPERCRLLSTNRSHQSCIARSRRLFRLHAVLVAAFDATGEHLQLPLLHSLPYNTAAGPPTPSLCIVRHPLPSSSL